MMVYNPGAVCLRRVLNWGSCLDYKPAPGAMQPLIPLVHRLTVARVADLPGRATGFGDPPAAADLVSVGIDQDVVVGRALPPAVHHACGGGVAAAGDLAASVAGVAGLGDARPGVAAVVAGVTADATWAD